MSVESVKKYLKKWGKDKDVKEFAQSSATVAEAALAVGCEPARIAKSLAFRLKKDNSIILVIAAGDARTDNTHFKRVFESKNTMLSPEELEQYIGHPIGGVCPFAIKDSSVKVYLDLSLQRFQSVFPAAGSTNSAVEMSLPELEQCSQYTAWVEVCTVP